MPLLDRFKKLLGISAESPTAGNLTAATSKPLATSQEHAFLLAIKENPEDDGLRLIFADWLEENGQPQRAEFVRLQVRLWKLYGDPEQTSLQRREQELLQEHQSQWVGGLERLVQGWEFHWGLLALRLTARQARPKHLQQLARLPAWSW